LASKGTQMTRLIWTVSFEVIRESLHRKNSRRFSQTALLFRRGMCSIKDGY
jgi:hypothetical protein